MIKKIFIILTVLISITNLYGQNQYSDLAKGEYASIPGIYAEMETSKGLIVFSLDFENAPLTTLNFINLVEEGFYNNLQFYRDIENYAIFSGDPANNGSSDAGYNFPMEINNVLKHNNMGILSMDGVSGLSNSSRFFISKTADPVLDAKYTAFGFLVEGENTFDKLKRQDSIISITISRTGNPALAFKTDKSEFDRLSKETLGSQLESFRLESPEVATAIESLGDGVQKTLTGIYYKINEEGNGVSPKKGDQVSVHYIGRLLDGTVFDNSIARGVPFEFPVGTKSVITGLDESVMAMTIGEKRTVIIPPNLAYGNNQAGPIAPNSWLMFDIDFVGIK